MKIYQVEDSAGTIAMVRADSKVKAIAHVVKAAVATQEELVDWLKSDGTEIQEAK